ncbi:MAG: tRNA pseudouridine synthase A [Promethearchaeota archaeon]
MKSSLEPQRYLFKFYYIGTNKFHGSQRQINDFTIEQCLLDALIQKKYIKNVKLSGFEVASRTDKYVSARGAAFSFISLKKPILMELNSILPNEVGLWAYSKVEQNFSSRFNSVYRHYKYIVHLPINFLERDLKKNLNLEIINKAFKKLEGKHNFKNFMKREKVVKKTIRDILSASVMIKNDYLIFDFKSKAFLRQQIRRMVKKLLELGTGMIDYSDFLDLFDPLKEISYQPADPTGLILWDIKFSNDIIFQIEPKSVERMMKYFLKQKLKFGHKHQLFEVLHQDNLS